MGTAPTWALLAATGLALAPKLLLGALWLAARATGGKPARDPANRGATVGYLAMIAAIFGLGYWTHSWLFVGVLVLPGANLIPMLWAIGRVVKSRLRGLATSSASSG